MSFSKKLPYIAFTMMLTACAVAPEENGDGAPEGGDVAAVDGPEKEVQSENNFSDLDGGWRNGATMYSPDGRCLGDVRTIRAIGTGTHFAGFFP